MEIDATVYPDREPPSELTLAEDKADYVHRVCSAFDFGIPPEEFTLRLMSGWKEIFDRFQLPHSPAYHALRAFFRWEPVARGTCCSEPGYRKLDEAEGRVDGYEDRV
ncbi:MAG: hypothetical protein AB1758_37400 [Candidatus Eremiobacterota bacterium]